MRLPLSKAKIWALRLTRVITSILFFANHLICWSRPVTIPCLSQVLINCRRKVTLHGHWRFYNVNLESRWLRRQRHRATIWLIISNLFYDLIKDLITVRNEVAKVMFLHLSVSHSVHRGVYLLLGGVPAPKGVHAHPPPGSRYPPGRCTPLAGTPPGQVNPSRQVHPPGRHTPWAGTPPSKYTPQQVPLLSPADGYCCGWYASYWNAFLY